jgi:hypothetical protein
MQSYYQITLAEAKGKAVRLEAEYQLLLAGCED